MRPRGFRRRIAPSDALGHRERRAVGPAEQGVGLGVAGTGLGPGVERDGAADAVRDITEVAERAGKVPLEDLGMQQLGLAGLDSLDKVVEVAGVAPRAAPLRAGLVLVAEVGGPGTAVEHETPF